MTSSRSAVRTFAGRFLIALLVGSLLMGAGVAAVNREVGRKLDRIPKIELTTAPIPPGGANYLLVGSDTRSFVSNPLEEAAFGDASTAGGRRSDTIMVVHVEPRAERTFIVSFPRDLWVTIPGHGTAKINSAYNYDQQTVIDTMKQNFDVDIHHFIELDFKTFVQLVDSLGKVPVYAPYPARDDYTGLDLPIPGCVELDGEQSLQWARSRYLEFQNPTTGRWASADIMPDIGRIGRQQEFMRRLAGIAVQRSLANPFTANVVADKIVGGLKVDDAFDRSSVFALLEAFRTLNPDDQSSLEMVTLPWKTGPSQGGQSVLYADTTSPTFPAIIDRLRTFDTRPRPTPSPQDIRVRVVNASGRNDLAVAVTKRLRELGFTTVDAVETSRERISGVEVRVAQEQVDKGKLLLRYVEPAASLSIGAVSDVDVTIVLGRGFESIAVPADAAVVAQAPDPVVAAAPPIDPASPPADPMATVPDAPVGSPATLTGFPAPAPRTAC
ncbi:MAG: LCP family protein [Actinomycetota bacterium]